MFRFIPEETIPFRGQESWNARDAAINQLHVTGTIVNATSKDGLVWHVP